MKNECEPRTILLVEDESAIRESLTEIMEMSGFKVLSAENGLIGWQSILNDAPDLVVSDVMMPEMNGFELLKKVRENKSTELLPMIMLTADAELESKLHGLELGADDYITKPFEYRELNLKISNLLQKREKLIRSVNASSNQPRYDSQDAVFRKKLHLLLDEQLDNSNLVTNSLANQLNMSLSTFNRRLQKMNSKSPNQYLKEYRLNRAKEMIQLNYGNISEIANKTGFSSLAYFSTSYKQFFGNTPTEDSVN